ncbi:MAG: FAD-binding protein [Bacteroidales bacterium]|nr:FAD-binding protein [Bacteroidales bacterium]
MIRIEEIKLLVSQNETELQRQVAEILSIEYQYIQTMQVVKKAIDSRNKSRLLWVYTVDVSLNFEEKFLLQFLSSKNSAVQQKIVQHRIRSVQPFHYQISHCSHSDLRPLVVGSGPCGLFAALILAKAGLCPVVIERGKKVEERIKEVERLFSQGILNPETNIQFGEGGAGTFSDGKLNTLVNNPKTQFVLEQFVEAGAPSEILYDAKPHIGTDYLRKVVVNLRHHIESLGGEFRFETRLTDLFIENGHLKSVFLNGKEDASFTDVILAIGHSARDTFYMLHDRKLTLQQKPFSIGVRIEHPATLINTSQYGTSAEAKLLPTAKYKMATHLKNGRSVYTFCMCPGGFVVAAASEPNSIVTNGMSFFAQAGKNSNSALLVNVDPTDFGNNHPLAGIEFQRRWERKAFEIGGGGYTAPIQLVGDFLKNRPSQRFGKVEPTYQPRVKLCNIADCLPDFVVESLRTGIVEMDKKLHGFALPDALLTAPETRSSAPVRILRDENCETPIKGIYSAGEGAGYAGGIVSSALDGLKVAESLIQKNQK